MERSSNMFRQDKKARQCRAFCVRYQLGRRPKPGHKGLFEKSPLESQKLCQNKVVCSLRSSLAYLSYKKGKLRKRGGEMFVYMFARNKTFYSKKNQFCIKNQAHFCSVFEIKSSFFFNRCN